MKILLKPIRKAKRMTQVELALKSGTDQTHISKLENHKSNASLSTLERLAAALGVPVAALLDGDQGTT
jgi:transcriptional regulator with XRE-family HTH domain